MYCMKCGQELPDYAAFCMRCGAAQSPKASQQAAEPSYEPEPQYELAEINFTVLRVNLASKTCRFFVDVIGPQGRYTYARGENFKKRKDKVMEEEPREHGHRIDLLVNKMISDGWEAMPRGDEWWQYRFRRRVK